MGIFVWFFIPETKAISLEKMDELFGVTQLIDHKAADPERGSIRADAQKKESVPTDTTIERV
jgi:hypothetical protein